MCLMHKGAHLMIRHSQLMPTWAMYINLSFKLITWSFYYLYNIPIRGSYRAVEGSLNNVKFRNVAIILSIKIWRDMILQMDCSYSAFLMQENIEDTQHIRRDWRGNLWSKSILRYRNELFKNIVESLSKIMKDINVGWLVLLCWKAGD